MSNDDDKIAPVTDLTGQPVSSLADADPPAEPDAAGDSEVVDGDLEDKRMSLLEHLQELRVRLRNAGIAFLVATIAGFVFAKQFFKILVAPTVAGIKAGTGLPADQQVQFINTTPTEGFWVLMKLAMVVGILVAAPLVFWELWKFVAPGLYKKEKRIALLVVGSTALCFVGGAIFGYFVISEPAAFFLSQMSKEFGGSGQGFEINTEWRMEDVTNYLMLTLAGCGVAFELPVLLVALGALGIVSARSLWKFNKYALILAAVAGAVLTPSTDPFTQLLLAGPLYALYNISILFVWLIERTRKKAADELDEDGLPRKSVP
jgi:sec-independent protein translocase protein TatC